jgi:phage shock protein PspC (stress-responsive transcriptional regulator)
MATCHGVAERFAAPPEISHMLSQFVISCLTAVAGVLVGFLLCYSVMQRKP